MMSLLLSLYSLPLRVVQEELVSRGWSLVEGVGGEVGPLVRLEGSLGLTSLAQASHALLTHAANFSTSTVHHLCVSVEDPCGKI